MTTLQQLIQRVERLHSLIRQLQGAITTGEPGTLTTPALANVTLGTGGTNDQTWTRHGRLILLDGLITLGTGGSFTGSPTVALPIAADRRTPGIAWAADVSGATRASGAIIPEAGFTTAAFFLPAAVTSSSPWTWDAGDIIRYSLVYEVSS